MNIQGPHDVTSGKEAIFALVENGQAAAIAKGLLTVWAHDDNTAAAGILQNTRGMRVIVAPVNDADGTCRQAGVAHTAIDANAAFASTRGPSFLIQTYGFRDDLQSDTTATTNIILHGAIVPSTDTAGKLMGFATEGTPLVQELTKVVGHSFEVVAINTSVTFQGFLRIM